MNKKIVFSFLSLLTVFIPLSIIADDERPVVVAVGPFANFTGDDSRSAEIVSLRDKVIANLLQKYNCVIVARSNGLALSNEHKLNVINQFNKDKADSVFLPAVDYSLIGFFKIGKRPSKGQRALLECDILIADIKSNLTTDLGGNKKDNVKKIKFLPSESDYYVDDVIKEIVKALKLKPKKAEYPKREGGGDETWAVLPIKRLESRKGLNQASDKDLETSIELALQDSGKIKRIVDHNEINRVLDELKITSLSNATEGIAGGIAKIIGADRVIMGSVSKLSRGKQDELRVDLFLVDGRMGVILDSATATSSSADLNKSVAELALKFTERVQKIPELTPATEEMLSKEANLYHTFLWSFQDLYIRSIPAAYFSDLVDVMHLLVTNNNELLIHVGYVLLYVVNDVRRQQRRKLVPKVDSLLVGIPVTQETHTILKLRAGLYASLGSSSDLKKAISFLERHLKEFPNTNNEYIKWMLVDCNYKLKRYAKAREYANQLKDKDGLAVINLYRGINDPANYPKELELLSKYRYRYYGNFYYTYNAVRLVQMLHKVKGPIEGLKEAKKVKGDICQYPEFQLELAEMYLETGDKETAAVILHNLKPNDIKRLTAFEEYTPDGPEERFAKYQKLLKEVGDTKVVWKRFPDVCKIPGKYKVYIQPLGNPEKELIENTIPFVEEKLGVRVVVMPKIPMPSMEDYYCSVKRSGMYTGYNVVRRLVKIMKAPEDAILMVNITNEDIKRGGSGYENESWDSGGTIISYRHMYHLDKYDMPLAMANLVCEALAHILKSDCRIKKCLFSCLEGGYNAYEKTSMICGRCQKKYANLDPSQIYAAFQKQYNAPSEMPWCYLKQDHPDNQKFQDLYKKQIMKVLAENKPFFDDKGPSSDPLAPEEADSKLANGLAYKYYELEKSACRSTDDCGKNPPLESGITDMFNLKKAKREEFFGLVFEGYIKIPYDGNYRFYLSADDGAKLWVGGKEVVNNDGLHGQQTKSGEIALKAGYHKIKLSYIQAGGGKLLVLYYRGPKTLGQQVPPDILFHKQAD